MEILEFSISDNYNCSFHNVALTVQDKGTERRKHNTKNTSETLDTVKLDKICTAHNNKLSFGEIENEMGNISNLNKH